LSGSENPGGCCRKLGESFNAAIAEAALLWEIIATILFQKRRRVL
jgi:hypothetical protein